MRRQGSSSRRRGSGRRFSTDNESSNDAQNSNSGATSSNGAPPPAPSSQAQRPGLSRGGGSARRGGGGGSFGGTGSGRSGGGRRQQEPSDQEIRHLIQSANVQHTVSLQLNIPEVEQLYARWKQFEQLCGTSTETMTHKATSSSGLLTIPLAVFGLHDWEELIAFQRVIAGLRRPQHRDQEAKVSARAHVQCDRKLLEWKYEVSVSPDAEDTLWAFTNELVLQARSAGVVGRPLLSSRSGSLVFTLASVSTTSSPFEGENTEAQQLGWHGAFPWDRIVVEASASNGASTKIVQMAHLPAISLTPPGAYIHEFPDLQYPSLAPLVDELLHGNAATERPSVVILRGIPGSGKSTLGREIAAIAKHRNASCAIFSADLFFIGARGYEFDAKKIGHAHNDCKKRFQNALFKNSTNILVVDNTHTQYWEYEGYAELALQHGCRLQILEMTCPDLSTCIQMAKRNSHGVPVAKVIQMYLRWEADDRALTFLPQFEYAMLNRNPVSRNSDSSLVYVGLFIAADERAKLLESCRPKHSNVFGEHVTLFYKPTKAYVRHVAIGEEVAVRAVELVQDDQGQTIRVEFASQISLKMRNKIPHVTISTRNNVGAYYSNELLESTTARRIALVNQDDKPSSKIVLTTRLGVAVLSQNRRLITTTSPFALYDKCSSNAKRAATHGAEHEFSNVFVLYVDEDDLKVSMQTTSHSLQSVLTKILLHEQVQHHMGSPCSTHRILCVKLSYSSDGLSSTQLVENMQRILLPSPTHLLPFDTFVRLPSDKSFAQFLQQERSSHAVKKVTVLTTSEQPFSSSSSAEMEILRPIAISINKIELPSVQHDLRIMVPYALTLTGAMDCLNLGVQEQTRHSINRGMGVAQDAWNKVQHGGSTVQRMDSSVAGLDATVIDLGVIMSKDDSAPLQELHERMLATMVENGVIAYSSKLVGAPGRIYFRVCSQASYCPVFRLQILAPSKSSPEQARMEFYNSLRHQVQQFHEIETFSNLVALVRATLRSHCLPIANEWSLAPAVDLLSETLALGFLQQNDEFQAACAAASIMQQQVERSEEMDALPLFYQMLQYLQSWTQTQWDDALGHLLRLYTGANLSSSDIAKALQTAAEICHHFRHPRNPDRKDSSKSSSIVLELLHALLDTPSAHSEDALLRAYINVENAEDSFAAQLVCDAVKLAASSEHVNPDQEIVFCAPSRLACKRVELAVASEEFLSQIMAEVRATTSLVWSELACSPLLSVFDCATDIAL
ncbi:putative muts-related protein involved in mismatch repair, partial [Globisporangium splendens]